MWTTLIFSNEKGFGDAYYILCPVCWNASIRVVRWENGTEETEECIVCKRIEEMME